ncbi:pseudouridine-5-phosphate glycosidase [Aurantimonas aggregata]|uniref:Pseudouridine-5'-phosphate glycosidase n=1 Tax=Aurantimonas aggregata TaxID=2047720 RepID=A0A6L9MBZ8_9HYPH|nr:pseudouridine-5'-phosphate glycosidase [Aurantimonas aggregata]NDV85196.1 pseudouridine-5-phosphate glycosidase [Aurantimonas aggregata]
MTPAPQFGLSGEVAAAKEAGQPLVALESTIVTHGMPYPQNLAMARRVEAIIREEGAVPATIAVLHGRLRIGLEAAELEGLATVRDAMKLSRADLAFAVASGRTGATTVAATMIAAALAGIRVFATGGIGGVHRGAETSFDISADLEELARTPVLVVCAGAKAILDLKKTYEVLETKGVPVVCHGADELPAFWSRGSGIPAPLRLDTPEQIAAFQAARTSLGIEGGMLIANPVPEEDALPQATVDGWIGAALADAEARGIAGKAVTPFLLQRMFELSDGRSLAANIALVENNARLAARIAVALHERG